MIEKAYQLLKMNLGLTSEKRKPYFENLLLCSKEELEEKGIVLSEEKAEDIGLLHEYAAWKYRSRENEKGMSRMLQFRIRNRIIKGRAKRD